MTISNSTFKNVFDYFEEAATCSGSMVVKVLDMRGRIAKTVRQSLEEGIGKICLNIDDLKKGKYIINIFNDDTFVKAVPYTKC